MLHFNIKDTEKYNQACNNLNQFRDDNDNKLGAEYDVFLVWLFCWKGNELF